MSDIGVGKAKGLAEVLKTPQFSLNHPAVDRKKAASGGYSGEMAFNKRLEGMVGGIEGIKMDVPGISDTIMQSLGGLRDFAIRARSKGIDVTGAPNFNDPVARKAFNAWNKALRRHEGVVEELSNQKKLQDWWLNAYRDGKMTGPADTVSGDIDPEKLLSESFRIVVPNIRDYNNAVDNLKPGSEEEHADLIAYRKSIVDSIDKAVNEFGLPEAEANALKAQMLPIKPFNVAGEDLTDDLLKAKIATEKARAADLYGRAADRKAKTQAEIENMGKSGSGKTARLPFLASVANGISEGLSPGPFAIPEGLRKTFTGTSFNGNPQYPFKTIEQGSGTGEYVVVYKGKKFSEEEREELEAAGGVAFNDEIRVSFSTENLLPAWQSIMSDSQWQKVEEKFGVDRIMDDKGLITAESVLDYVSSQSNPVESAANKRTFGTLNLSTLSDQSYKKFGQNSSGGTATIAEFAQNATQYFKAAGLIQNSLEEVMSKQDIVAFYKDVIGS